MNTLGRVPTYELWESIDDSGVSLSLFPAEKRLEHVTSGDPPQDRLDGSPLRLIWVVEAANWEDAMTAMHERMGWEPYRPMTA